jgi:hypothetical protein
MVATPVPYFPEEAELLQPPNSLWQVTGIFEADANFGRAPTL